MSIAFICNSQNVYILGNATPEDADKIVSIVRQMHLKLSIKECSVFYNVASSSTIRIETKKNFDEGYLRAQMKSLFEHSARQVSPSSQRRQQYSAQIKDAGNTNKLHEITGNYGNARVEQIASVLMDSLHFQRVKPKSVSILIVFYTPKPTVSIITPADGDSLTTTSVVVSGMVSDPLCEVNVRLDGGTFKRATVKEFGGNGKWTLTLDVEDKSAYHTLEAIAISDVQSELVKSTFKYYKKLQPPKPKPVDSLRDKEKVSLMLSHIFPHNNEVVQKCYNNAFYHYVFKFSVFDPSIDIRKIRLLILNDKNTILFDRSIEEMLIRDPDCMRTLSISSNRNDYCIFVLFADIEGFESPCDIRDDLIYKYHYKYLENYLPTDNYIVNFPSFDTDTSKEHPCDCN